MVYNCVCSRLCVAVFKVEPLTGLVEGGTLITLRGSDLGTSFDQVRHSVRVAGVSCELLASQYVVSRQSVLDAFILTVTDVIYSYS